MSTLIIESPTQEVKKGTRGQIIITNTGNIVLTSTHRARVEIEDTANNNLIWRGQTYFKDGSISLDLVWPDFAGNYRITVKTTNVLGVEIAFTVKYFKVVD